MGEQARDLVRALFAPERMCAVLDEIYSSLLGAAHASGDPAAGGRRAALDDHSRRQQANGVPG
jgi:hypothetical protein